MTAEAHLLNPLAVPRDPIIDRALTLARRWCDGHMIDDAPALAHAVKVARTVAAYAPDATPQMIAAALLHDAPIFAPGQADLDLVLTHGVAEGVAPIVRALHAEHEAMMAGGTPSLCERHVTVVMAADKLVAFRSLVERASRCADEAAFWRQRTVLRGLFGYFRAWHATAQPMLPDTLGHDLILALDRLETAATSGRRCCIRG